MKKTFKLKKGEILFDKDKIIINDDAKKQKLSGLTFGCFGAVISIMMALNYMNSYKFWMDLFTCVLSILAICLLMFQTAKSVLHKNEIKSLEIRKRLGNKFLDIKLLNKKTRRVTNLDNIEELEQYIKTYL